MEWNKFLPFLIAATKINWVIDKREDDTIREDYCRFRADDLRLDIRNKGTQKRINVSFWIQDKNHSLQHFHDAKLRMEKDGIPFVSSINLSAEKSLEQIAKDIFQRIFNHKVKTVGAFGTTTFNLVVATTNLIEEEHNQQIERMKQLVQTIRQTLPGASIPAHKSQGVYETELWTCSPISELRAFDYKGKQSISFRVDNIPVDVALEFLAKIHRK